MPKSLGETNLVLDKGGGVYGVDTLTNDWLLLHGLEVSPELRATRATWIIHPAFSSQVWMDLQASP